MSLNKRPIFKYFGGKFPLINWLKSHVPNNFNKYGEIYLGAGSLFWNLDKAETVILNDINTALIDVYRWVQHASLDDIAWLRNIEYNETNFNKAKNNKFGPISELIKRRFSRGGIGITFGKSSRFRGGQNEYLNAWTTFIKDFEFYVNKLQNVTLLNVSAIQTLQLFDTNSFIYMDPTYISDTRTVKRVYEFEMTNKDHEELLNNLKNHTSKIMISGYDSDLYNNMLSNWNKFTKDVPNHSGQNKKKQRRVECLWKNF